MPAYVNQDLVLVTVAIFPNNEHADLDDAICIGAVMIILALLVLLLFIFPARLSRNRLQSFVSIKEEIRADVRNEMLGGCAVIGKPSATG